MNPEGFQFFIEIGIKELRKLQRTFSAKAFHRRRIDVTQNEVKVFLAGKTKSTQICLFWENIAKLNVIVFQTAFLTSPQRISEEYTGSDGIVCVCFHGVSHREL